MNLYISNFKTTIDETILDRGYSYFLAGRVIDIEEDRKGRWTAQVEGNEVYTIEIEQDQKGMLLCDCNCPYNQGPYCKHIAAALYAIEESAKDQGERKPGKEGKKRITRPERIHKTLVGMAKENLVELLEELADGDQQIAHMILARFGDAGEEKKAYTRMVKDALKMGKNKHGFIDYYGSGRAANGVRDILARADMYAEKGNYHKTIPIYQAVIEAVVPAIAYADDSNGELGDCIYCGLKGLSEAIEKLPADEQQKAFEYCLEEAQKERYAGWDWGWDLAQIAADMVVSDDQRRRLHKVLDAMSANNGDDEAGSPFFSNYQYELAERIKLSVIDRLDDDEIKRAFLSERVALEYFRERLARFHIERGNLQEARALCDEWLNQTNQGYPGFRSVFLALLLEVAQHENKVDEISRLAEELFIDTREFNYFELIKAGTPSAAWPDSRDQLIAKVSTCAWSADLALDIFVQEEMWQQLLHKIEKSHRYIVEHYRVHLEARFPEEMGAIYEWIVWELMGETANRRGYKEACRYIRRMKKLKQGQRADALVNDLRTKYNRRPALLEELSKI
jgi:hypothetical protein